MELHQWRNHWKAQNAEIEGLINYKSFLVRYVHRVRLPVRTSDPPIYLRFRSILQSFDPLHPAGRSQPSPLLPLSLKPPKLHRHPARQHQRGYVVPVTMLVSQLNSCLYAVIQKYNLTRSVSLTSPATPTARVTRLAGATPSASSDMLNRSQDYHQRQYGDNIFSKKTQDPRQFFGNIG